MFQMHGPTKRKLCPHCGVCLSRSAYYLHRRQFYSFETGQWQRKSAAPDQQQQANDRQANECEIADNVIMDSRNEYSSSSDLSSSESDTFGSDIVQVRDHNVIHTAIDSMPTLTTGVT